MRSVSTLLLALASIGSVSAGTGSAWLDGSGPLDKDIGLPAESFHHLGSYSARWVDEDLLSPYVRRHARDFVVKRAAEGDIYPPQGCNVTLVNTLQRHGARSPTPNALKKMKKAKKLLADALAGIPDEKLDDPSLGFLRDLPTPDGLGDLVPYGALQAYYSGLFDREVYGHLADKKPFVRATGNYGNQSEVPSDRVLYTGRWWLQAFENKGFPDGDIDDFDKVRHITNLPELDVVVSGSKGVNNTLVASTCPAYGSFTSDKVETYANNTLALVANRLQNRLRPANFSLSPTDVDAIMTHCSFISLTGANVTDGDLKLNVSPVCGAFDPDEWSILDYYYSVRFYYRKSAGNKYYRAAYQGYMRELYARLANKPVVTDPFITTINTTTLHNNGFPLPGNGDIAVYGDFTHDSNIAPIAQTFGLFPGDDLPVSEHAEQTYKGPFAASKVVPYQTKHAWEKISCENQDVEYLRVRVNEAVHPVVDSWCPVKKGDKGYDQTLISKGLCPLPVALKNLEWANGEGEWPTCFGNQHA